MRRSVSPLQWWWPAPSWLAFAVEGMDWAYPVSAERQGRRPDNEKMLTVPGSKKQYTAAQIGDGFNPPDWFPDEHPPMPAASRPAGSQASGPARCAICRAAAAILNPPTWPASMRDI